MNRIKNILKVSMVLIALLTIGMIGNAAPSASLDQCRNGAAGTPENCTGSAWVNGNLGAQQAHLAEGYSIPYRARLLQLPPNTEVSLIIGFDIKTSAKNAIDYITYFDRLDKPFGSHFLTFGHTPEIVDPSSDVAFTGPTTTFEIPAPSSSGTPVDNQPTTSFNSLSAGDKLMTLYGGTINDIQYVSQGTLTDASAETRIMVNFTTNDTCPVVKGSQQCTAVLSWGGHIASQDDWGMGNSASAISGSPYHMRLIGWNLGNLGNQDRSLAASAVVAPALITIVKNTIPDDEQEFDFTTSGTGLSNFHLTDNGTGTNNTTFGGLATGMYTVQETMVEGFVLTDLSCADATGDTTTDLATGTATINVNEGEHVTCTYENTKNATLTIVKDAIPDDSQDFTFTGTGSIGEFTLDDDNDPTLSNNSIFNIEPGTYSITETVPSGWNLTSATCDNGDNIDSIILGAGESVTCTFVDTKNATLKVIKDALPDDSQIFNYTVTGTGLDPFDLKDDGVSDNFTAISLEPGTYSVTETIPANWELTSIDITDPSGGSSQSKSTANLDIAAGETVTVLFTNTKNATLTIVKDAIPDDSQDFTFTGTGSIGEFTLDDDNDPTLSNTSIFNIEPGTYSVTETVPSGWNLTSATCDNGDNIDSIILGAGESVTCTFTNNKLHLSFIKQGTLDFAGKVTGYSINVTNDGNADLTIVDMTDATGSLACDVTFPKLLAVNEKISCSTTFATDSDINAATYIEILSDPTNIIWRV
jgi:hypothetical protein